MPEGEILMRTVRVLHGLMDAPDDTMILAIKMPDFKTLGVTYGDLRALTRQLATAHERLGRIAGWHTRESGEHGLVGDCCNECLHRHPCTATPAIP